MSKEHGTQLDRIRNALLAGVEINPLMAWQTYGVYRLAARIHQLRKEENLPILDRRINVQNRYGEKCPVSCYFLSQDYLKTISRNTDDNRQTSFA